MEKQKKQTSFVALFRSMMTEETPYFSKHHDTLTQALQQAQTRCHPRLLALLRDTVARVAPHGACQIKGSFHCLSAQGEDTAVTAATYHLLTTTHWTKELPGYDVQLHPSPSGDEDHGRWGTPSLTLRKQGLNHQGTLKGSFDIHMHVPSSDVRPHDREHNIWRG